MKSNQIEIQRSNVTLSQFFNYIKRQCEMKGMYFDIDEAEFENTAYPINRWYIAKDNKKITFENHYRYEDGIENAPCKSETIKMLPLDWQTYMSNWDGSLFNEICEFTYDDGKNGHGYYYQVFKEV